MQMRYERKAMILPSQLDPEGQLSFVAAFNLFMDTATLAAGELGVGWDYLMKRGLFWITVKARVRFLKPPSLLDTVKVATWPEAPGEKRCNRHYEIIRNGETLAVGKTEWAIVSTLTGRPKPMDRVLPAGLEYPAEQASPEPFPIIDESFPAPPFAEHRVTATDTDMARHMNNVAYVRAIIDGFSAREWKRLGVRQMDVIFLNSAHEGDVIRFQRRDAGSLVDIRGSLPGGRTAVLARLTR